MVRVVEIMFSRLLLAVLLLVAPGGCVFDDADPL